MQLASGSGLHQLTQVDRQSTSTSPLTSPPSRSEQKSRPRSSFSYRSSAALVSGGEPSAPGERSTATPCPSPKSLS
eukprot:1226945-Pyramimonas_sp.AAC.1